MRIAPDLTSQKFGMLHVTGRAGSSDAGSALWRCVCDCGNTKVVTGGNLRSGNTSSCGCIGNRAKSTHGHTRNGKRTRTYRIWSAMIERCTREAHPHYADYGGRGIEVCLRWKKFENFLVDMGEVPLGLTLDRYPDVNGNYEPGNCRWADRVQQANNCRSNRRIEVNGESRTVAEWARHLGIPHARLRMRLHMGWAPEQALEFEVRPQTPGRGNDGRWAERKR